MAELKLEQNFFEIGGNSIKAAIIVGRLLQGIFLYHVAYEFEFNKAITQR